MMSSESSSDAPPVRLVRRMAALHSSLFAASEPLPLPDASFDPSIVTNPSYFRFKLLNTMSSDGSDSLEPSTNATTPDYTQGLVGVNLAMDQTIVRYLWISITTVLLLVLVSRMCQLFIAHIRHIYCLHANETQQRYWTFDKSWWYPFAKRAIIYAPLGSKRHNRELQLSSAVNYGTLPGRLHAVLLLVYVLSNVVYCLLLPYGKFEPARVIAELRGRSGMLAVVNMVPLIILAGRNNPGIALLKISFDTFNLFHRWIGRLVVVESVLHVLAWYANIRSVKGAGAATASFKSGVFIQAGLIAILAMVIILVQSLSVVRHAFYEIFLHLHQLLAIFAIAGVYIHLGVANLPALPFIKAVVGIWLTERVIRLLRLIRVNINFRRRQLTYVHVEALEAEACRVTFKLPNHITIRPGSHVYAYIPSVSLWQSHPFSIAWTDIHSEPPTGLPFADNSSRRSSSSLCLEKQASQPTYNRPCAPTEVSLIVAARTGMTRKLYDRACASKTGQFVTTGFAEGPYAGHDSLSSYGTVIMFAGGAGITHHLVQIRHLLASAQAGTVATRKLVLVWSIRDQDSLKWVREWMDEILMMPGRKGILSLVFYVTRPRNQEGCNTFASSSIQIRPRRCDPGEVLDDILPDRVGATMVTVCGPGAFADEVRAAVRARIEIGCIDLNEESFTW